MKANRKYEPKKESRGWYFVEYYPPISNNKFASLQLIVTIENAVNNDIVNAMEKELSDWLTLYPIPLFVSVFDNKGALYDFDEIKKHKYLTGFLDQNGKACLYWRLLENEEIPDTALNREYVDNLYSSFTFKTYAELDVDRQKRRRKIILGWYIFFIWLVAIPLFIAILEYFSNWLSFVVLVYSFYKALQKGLELLGEVKKSNREKERELEERLKDHYYYHCQMNPEGFKKLKLENFEKMGKDEIAKEADALKAGNH